MSDPFWFLENLEESETGKSKKGATETPEKGKIEPISELDGLTLGYSQDSDTKYFDQQPAKGKQSDNMNVLENKIDNVKTEEGISFDDESKLNIDNTVSELAKDATNGVDIPEIKISINADNIKKLLEENGLNNENSSMQSSGQNDNGKIVITLSTNDNGQNQLNQIKTENSTAAEENMNNVWNTSEGASQPKIYVILKDKNNSATGEKDAKFYSEVGSTVVNLNDLIPNGSQPISGNEKISSAVNFDGGDGKSKVELVITLKDHRKNKADKFENKRKIRSYDPWGRFLDSRIARSKSGKKERYGSSNEFNSSSTETTWESTGLSGADKNDWTKETKDSFIREDGARCYRTVTTTPQGRKVKTECYKGEQPHPRHGNYRNINNFRNTSSFWDVLDEEFNQIFSAAKSILFF